MPNSYEHELLLRQRHYAELCMEWVRTNHEYKMRRLGLKYDPNQPRVGAGSPAGGQWLGQNTGRGDSGDGNVTGSVPKQGVGLGPTTTPVAPVSSGDPSAKPSSLIQPVQFNPATPQPVPRPMPGRLGMIMSALRLFNYLTATTPGTTVVEFTSREYLPSAADPFDLAMTRTLSRSETQAYCPHLPLVQDLTDRIDARIRLENPNLSPQDHGTAVHSELKRQIEANPEWGLKAEKSYIKTRGEARYGELGSIRIDALAEADQQTVCIYDIKTGRAPLTLARSNEMARESHTAFMKYFNRFIITEVRPTP